MFVKVFTYLCLVGVVFGSYSDCGSEVGEIVNVQVGGCGNAKRCQLRRGTNATIEIIFKSKEESDELKAKVHGILLNIPIEFDLPNPNGCLDSGVQCPLKVGDTYTYKAILPVRLEYPKVTVDVKWELKDKDAKDIVCVLIPAKIV